MRIVARCLLVLGLLAALPALAQQESKQEPSGRVGRVGVIAGTLAFYGPGDSEWSAAQVNLPVSTGGWFATDPQSRAQLRVGPDTINLANDTQLNIADLRDGVMQLALSQGRLGVRMHRPAWRKDDTTEIDIARGGVWLLEPGDYDIDSGAADQPTRITVFEGSARFAGGGVDQVVKAGERLVLTGGDALTAAVEQAEPDDFANWCRERDISRDRIASARRVSPAMTGFEELDQHGEWANAADYGAVWYPKSLPADWAPYRAGRWVWVEPWGWNWVDDQPWGFAPFHYGRWAQVNDRWGWVPGEFVAQPVYAPALVAFLPQPVIEVAGPADAGPPVGWFPLAPGEVYFPSYSRNPTYIRNLNITNVRINVINQVTTALLTRRGLAEPPPVVLHQRFVNRAAATIVPTRVVVDSRPVAPANLRAAAHALRQAAIGTLPPPAVARPAGTPAQVATAPNTASAPQRVQMRPARPNFAQLAHAPRVGHDGMAALPAALPGAPAAPPPTPPGVAKPGEVPAATAIIPPLGPHHPPAPAGQPPAAANGAPVIQPGPPARPDFANLPRWRPHGAPQQAQTPTGPAAPDATAGAPGRQAGGPVASPADPGTRRQVIQELAQQRATAADTARQQEVEQRAARLQAIAAQHAQQRAAAEAAGQPQAQQRAAQQQAIAEQRAARAQALAAQLAQQRAAADATRQQQAQQRDAQQAAAQQAAAQRATQQQATAAQQAQQRAAQEQASGGAQQAQQRAAAEAARQQQAVAAQQAQQHAAQQQAAAAQQAQQRAAQQQAAAAQQAQQRAAQQQAAAAQQAQQRAAQQQAVAAQQAQQHAAQQQQAVAAQQAQQRAAQQQAAAAQQAQQRAAQQQAAAAQQAQQRAAQQQAAAAQQAQQRAAQQQAAAAQQAQQRAAQQQAAAAQQAQQKAGQKQKEAHACGAPGLPACPPH